MTRTGDERFSAYDLFAWFYQRYWAGKYRRQSLASVERLLLPRLQDIPGANRILDLCCGTGLLAKELVDRGFAVTGLDGSAEMLRYARAAAPTAEFILADARDFRLPRRFDAVVSTFDSLNFILDLDDLVRVFRNVHGALLGGGWFVFDMNTDEARGVRWEGSYGIVEDDHVCVVRASFDAGRNVGTNALTMFRLIDRVWQRSDVTLSERFYAEADVRGALESAGFADLAVHNAAAVLDLPEESGRRLYLARKADDVR